MSSLCSCPRQATDEQKLENAQAALRRSEATISSIEKQIEDAKNSKKQLPKSVHKKLLDTKDQLVKLKREESRLLAKIDETEDGKVEVCTCT